MTQTNQTTAPAEIDDLLAAIVAHVEAENAEVQDTPVEGPVTFFPSPFAD